MLFVKDFRTNLTSYRLILEDSKTNMGQTKVYDFNSDRFGGVSSRAAYAMLNDINNGEYKITLNINTNNSTLELLATLNGYANNEYVSLNFNQFKNAMPTFFTEKLYAVLKSNNNSISYIAGYKEENNKISLITIKETAKNDNIIDQHFNLIKTTGEYNGKRLQKFNRVQLLALMFMSKNFNAKFLHYRINLCETFVQAMFHKDFMLFLSVLCCETCEKVVSRLKINIFELSSCDTP